MQPELFPADEAHRVAALPHDQREWTRAPVDTSGPAAYAILVRAPGDPAMTVEVADATADVVGPNAIAALWALKAAGVVEHTIDVPVLWRLVR